MNLKHLFAALAMGLLATTTAAQPPAPKVTIKSELASPLVLENSQDKNYLKVSLTGFPLHATKRSPINLALVIDRSGSMGGERIEQATEAAVMAVNTLSAQDTLSVVIYDDVVDVIVPAAKVDNKAKLISQIRERLTARGGTALFAGVSRVSKKTVNSSIRPMLTASSCCLMVRRTSALPPPASWQNWVRLPPAKGLPSPRWVLAKATMKI